MSAVHVKLIGPEKRVRPYWKCVRPRQKQWETILLLKCVSLKISESEHSDTGFYYPVSFRLPKCCNYLLTAKRSNATARGLVPPKNENEKKSTEPDGRRSTVEQDGKIFGSRSGRTDLKPNIFPSGPPTQSIST